MQDNPTAPLQKVIRKKGLPEVDVLRLDQLPSWTSGNKFYKLRFIIERLISEGLTHVVSKGGMFSNHLAALSNACRYFNLQMTAIVRAYEEDDRNPSIQYLKRNKARIVYTHPDTYKVYDEDACSHDYPDAWFIEEGGKDHAGIQGSATILSDHSLDDYSYIAVAGGTMTTALGLMSDTTATGKIIIMPAWKGCTEAYIENLIDTFRVEVQHNWMLWPDYHLGGFGKCLPEEFAQIEAAEKKYTIPLDPVYTGKLWLAIEDQIQKEFFTSADKILMIHTGGLQGKAGWMYMNEKRSASKKED